MSMCKFPVQAFFVLQPPPTITCAVQYRHCHHVGAIVPAQQLLHKLGNHCASSTPIMWAQHCSKPLFMSFTIIVQPQHYCMRLTTIVLHYQPHAWHRHVSSMTFAQAQPPLCKLNTIAWACHPLTGCPTVVCARHHIVSLTTFTWDQS